MIGSCGMLWLLCSPSVPAELNPPYKRSKLPAQAVAAADTGGRPPSEQHHRAEAPDAVLTLHECVRLALKDSPQARAAVAARQAALTEGERERPVARPTLSATVSGMLQGPRVLFPRPDDTQAIFLPERMARADLILEQPLYQAGLGAARQRYAAQRQIAELDYRRTLADLALAVQKSCLDLLRAEAGMTQAQGGLEQARRFQALVKLQIVAGVAKPVEAEAARAQTAEADAGVAQAQGEAMLARMALNRLLGRPLTASLTLASLHPPIPLPPGPEGAVAHALTHRPELISLEQSLLAARAGISLARVEAQPTLHFRGQMTEQTPTALVREHYAAATLELRWTLLDGGKARLDARSARSQVDRLTALLEDARQGVTLEVMQAWQRLRDVRGQIELTRVQRESLEAFARIAETAVAVGQGSSVALHAALRQVQDARQKELRALYDLYTAQADFEHAQGMEAPGQESGSPGTGEGATR